MIWQFCDNWYHSYPIYKWWSDWTRELNFACLQNLGRHIFSCRSFISVPEMSILWDQKWQKRIKKFKSSFRIDTTINDSRNLEKLAIFIVLIDLIHWINLSIYSKLRKWMYFTNITNFRPFYGISKLFDVYLPTIANSLASENSGLDFIKKWSRNRIVLENKLWLFWLFSVRKNCFFLLVLETLKVWKTFQFS